MNCISCKRSDVALHRTNPLGTTPAGWMCEPCITKNHDVSVIDHEAKAVTDIIDEANTKTIGKPKSGMYWLSLTALMGQIAHWSVRISPYPCPASLHTVLHVFHAKTKSHFDGLGIVNVDRETVAGWLNNYLFSQPEVKAWNERRNGNTAQFGFTSRYDGPADPDDSFVDLDALRLNILNSLDDEAARDEAEIKPFASRKK